MRIGIIGGSGVDSMGGVDFERQQIPTRYGPSTVFVGLGQNADLVFLPRHGPEHTVPPHRVNYRAHLKALQSLGVERVMATFAVGSLVDDIPPLALVALDQFLDFTHSREGTFFDGGASGLVHTDVTEPYCRGLRQQLLALAPMHGLELRPSGVYVCTNGPRFETASEVRMYAQLGGEVVGMTGVPEATLARELGLHYAAVAFSVNWAAGLKGPLEIKEAGVDKIRARLLPLFVETLRSADVDGCQCLGARHVIHEPRED